jgi:hypothetical protein
MRTTIQAATAAAALLSLLFSAASAAEVEVRTAADLVKICSIADDDPRADGARGFCYGFLSGTAQYHHALNAGKKGKPLFCLPEHKVTRAEGATLFVAWAKANPQHMGEAPVDALARFAVATWPCKRTKK